MACVPKDWNALCDLVDDKAHLRNIEELEHKSRDALSRDYGEWFRDRQTDWEGILNALRWCRTLLDMVGRKPSDRLSGLACGSDVSFDADASIKRIESLQSDYQRGLRLLDERFDASASPWGTWDAAPFDDLKAWLESIHKDADSAANWIEFKRAADGLDHILGPGAVRLIRGATSDAHLVPGIVKRRLFAAWLHAVDRQDLRLRDFTALDHEGVRRKFSEMDQDLPDMLREKVPGGGVCRISWQPNERYWSRPNRRPSWRAHKEAPANVGPPAAGAVPCHHSGAKAVLPDESAGSQSIPGTHGRGERGH